jgi:hypothetical protein
MPGWQHLREDLDQQREAVEQAILNNHLPPEEYNKLKGAQSVYWYVARMEEVWSNHYMQLLGVTDDADV